MMTLIPASCLSSGGIEIILMLSIIDFVMVAQHKKGVSS